MKQQTGETYQSAHFAKALLASDAKVGKTTFMIASTLGVFPGQKVGGVVDRPENLHVITFDEAALGGVKRFLLETCKAPKEALGFKVYNMEEDLRKITVSPYEYDRSFYNTILTTIQRISERASGNAVLIVSSLTSLAEGLQRGTAGPAAQKKGAGMDQSKWQDFSNQVTEIRHWMQQDKWHCLWEAHVYRRPPANKDDEPEESLQVPGRSGVSFANNVAQVFRVRRVYGQVLAGTACDRVFLDTRASFGFLAGGRNFTEALSAKEEDLTRTFEKLGLQTGHWGAKSNKPKAQSQEVTDGNR